MSRDLDVGMKCVKYMLYVANFLFLITSILIISIGTVIKDYYSQFEDFMVERFFSPSQLMIAIGILMLFIAAFGCYGAYVESTLAINVYAVFLTIIFILELSVAISATALRYNVRSAIHNEMEEVFKNYGSDPESKSLVNFAQHELECCGIIRNTEWDDCRYVGNNTCKPPSSCHIDYDSDKPTYSNGCELALIDVIYSTSLLLVSGAMSVAFVQIIGIVFARILAATIRSLKTSKLVAEQIRREEIYSQIILNCPAQPTEKPIIFVPEESEA